MVHLEASITMVNQMICRDLTNANHQCDAVTRCQSVQSNLCDVYWQLLECSTALGSLLYYHESYVSSIDKYIVLWVARVRLKFKINYLSLQSLSGGLEAHHNKQTGSTTLFDITTSWRRRSFVMVS